MVLSSEPLVLSTKEMARLLGVTTQALDKLRNAGTLTQIKRGRWDAAKTVQKYIAHRVTGVEQARAAPGAERLREARAKEVEQRIAEKDRQLIDIIEVEDYEAAKSALFLDLLNGLPARITRDENERQRIEALINVEKGRLSARFTEMSEALKSGDDFVSPNAGSVWR